MDDRAARRIKGRPPRRGTAKSRKPRAWDSPNILLFILASLCVHAAVLSALMYLPSYFKKPVRMTVYDISLTSLPGPAGGGGKSPEAVKPPIHAAKQPPREVEPIRVPGKPSEKREAKQEVPKVLPQAPKGPGQGPVGGGGKKGLVQGPIALEGGIEFPFGFYLSAVQKKVESMWNPPALWGGSAPKAVISFHIDKAGRITDVSVETTSGIELYDQMALVAVKKSSPLPPLPLGYSGDQLGVHYTFIAEKQS